MIAVVEKLQDLQDRGRAGVSFPSGWDPLTNPGRMEDNDLAANCKSVPGIEPGSFVV